MKGRGLSFTEGRHEWHAKVPTADDVATARIELGFAKKGRVVTRPMREAWADALSELAVDDRDILGPRRRPRDVHPGRSVRRGPPGAVPPDGHCRSYEHNTGVVVCGLATLGYVPWLSSFAVFFTHRAADQVRMLVAQTHANVKIGAAYSGLLTGFTGKTHQDVEDLAIMRAMPGMTVIAPGDATECVAAVRWATKTPGPVYLRLARDAAPDLFDATYEFELGRVIRLRAGTDVLIVSTGLQSARCLAAAELLETEGIRRASFTS